jgi:hypothetical protein
MSQKNPLVKPKIDGASQKNGGHLKIAAALAHMSQKN